MMINTKSSIPTQNRIPPIFTADFTLARFVFFALKSCIILIRIKKAGLDLLYYGF